MHYSKDPIQSRFCALSLPVLREANLPCVLGLGGLTGKTFLRRRQVTKVWFMGKREKIKREMSLYFCRDYEEFWSSSTQTKQQMGQEATRQFSGKHRPSMVSWDDRETF